MPNFDESTNYLTYPTLMRLPRQPDRLDAQIQHLQAEKQTCADEILRLETKMAQIETELQRLEAEQRRRAEAERKARQKKRNILGNVGNDENPLSLDGVTAKENITEVYFMDTLTGAPKGAADLSEAQDGCVLCWTEGTVQFIAGDGGVVGGSSCAYLFAGYVSVTAIHFNGNFDTSNVTNMSRMFDGCKSLVTLNLVNWDTSSVTNMSWMFFTCTALASLNLSGWDTSSATDMRWMFAYCISLTDFNPKGLDTRHADTTDMYAGIGWLTKRKWKK